MPQVHGWSEDEFDRRALSLAALIRKVWRSIARFVAAQSEQSNTVAMSAARSIIPEWQSALDGQIIGYVEKMYLDAAGNVADTLDVPDGMLIGDDLVDNYVTEARNRLVGIGDDVWQVVQNQIALGNQQGETVSEIAARIRNVTGVSDARSLTIARTEVHAAHEAGSHAQAMFVDPQAEKVWLATEDERTRESHRLADGQKVKIGDSFSVGTTKLRFPGDPLGDPGEIINCRCSVAYNFDMITAVEPTKEPALAAAAHHSGGMWKPQLHPRGNDGKFIEKGAISDFFKKLSPGLLDTVHAVSDLNHSTWKKLTPEQKQHISDSVEKQLPKGSQTYKNAVEKLASLGVGEKSTPNVSEHKVIPKPDPSSLKSTGKTLGSHGATVYTDSEGNRWLFKKQPKFATDLDVAAAELQRKMGRPSPETYAIKLDGKDGSIQRMIEGQDAFGKPWQFEAHKISGVDKQELLREQPLDWLLSNFDSHSENYIKMPNGQIAGVDKGNGLKFFGQDSLSDYKWRPNEHRTVYSHLWSDYAAGKTDITDDDLKAMRESIDKLQAVSDDDIRKMFRPYAEGAHAMGNLATAKSNSWGDKLHKRTVEPQNVNAFLDAMVARKHALKYDFGSLYAKATADRNAHLGEHNKSTYPKALLSKTDDAPKIETPKALNTKDLLKTSPGNNVKIPDGLKGKPGDQAKITTGFVWGKHKPGDVVLEDEHQTTRVVWNGKKYEMQSLDDIGDWAKGYELTKKDFYANHKGDTGWVIPGGEPTPPEPFKPDTHLLEKAYNPDDGVDVPVGEMSPADEHTPTGDEVDWHIDQWQRENAKANESAPEFMPTLTPQDKKALIDYAGGGSITPTEAIDLVNSLTADDYNGMSTSERNGLHYALQDAKKLDVHGADDAITKWKHTEAKYQYDKGLITQSEYEQAIGKISDLSTPEAPKSKFEFDTSAMGTTNWGAFENVTADKPLYAYDPHKPNDPPAWKLSKDGSFTKLEKLNPDGSTQSKSYIDIKQQIYETTGTQVWLPEKKDAESTPAKLGPKINASDIDTILANNEFTHGEVIGLTADGNHRLIYDANVDGLIYQAKQSDGTWDEENSWPSQTWHGGFAGEEFENAYPNVTLHGPISPQDANAYNTFTPERAPVLPKKSLGVSKKAVKKVTAKNTHSAYSPEIVTPAKKKFYLEEAATDNIVEGEAVHLLNGDGGLTYNEWESLSDKQATNINDMLMEAEAANAPGGYEALQKWDSFITQLVNGKPDVTPGPIKSGNDNGHLSKNDWQKIEQDLWGGDYAVGDTIATSPDGTMKITAWGPGPGQPEGFTLHWPYGGTATFKDTGNKSAVEQLINDYGSLPWVKVDKNPDISSKIEHFPDSTVAPTLPSTKTHMWGSNLLLSEAKKIHDAKFPAGTVIAESGDGNRQIVSTGPGPLGTHNYALRHKIDSGVWETNDTFGGVGLISTIRKPESDFWVPQSIMEQAVPGTFPNAVPKHVPDVTPSIPTPSTPTPTIPAGPVTVLPHHKVAMKQKLKDNGNTGYWSKPEKIWESVKEIQAQPGYENYSPLDILKALDSQLKTKEPNPFETKITKWAATKKGAAIVGKTGIMGAPTVSTPAAPKISLTSFTSENSDAVWSHVQKMQPGDVLATTEMHGMKYRMVVKPGSTGGNFVAVEHYAPASGTWNTYFSLTKSDNFKNHLESSGVDNWNWTPNPDIKIDAPSGSTYTLSDEKTPLEQMLPPVDISHLSDAKKQELYTQFKGQPSTYLSSSPSSLYAALNTIGDEQGLSLGQIIAVIDEVGAKKVNKPDEHLFHAKILEWLKSPKGAAVASGKALPKPETPSFYDDAISTNHIPSFDESSKFAYNTISVPQSLPLWNKMVAAHGKPWTASQESALKTYTGGTYYSINAYLYGAVDDITPSNEKTLKQAQLGMRPSIQPLLLHRGTGFDGVGHSHSHTDLEKKIGTTWKAEGFFSTSTGGKAAFDSKPVIIEIEAPPGTPMAWVNHISQHKGENEMLLAAGLNYKIISVKKNGWQSVVRVRVVPPEAS